MCIFSAQCLEQSRYLGKVPFFPPWTYFFILFPLNKAKVVEIPYKVPRQPQGDQLTQGPVPTRNAKVQDVWQRPGEIRSCSQRLGSVILGVWSPDNAPVPQLSISE